MDSNQLPFGRPGTHRSQDPFDFGSFGSFSSTIFVIPTTFEKGKEKKKKKRKIDNFQGLFLNRCHPFQGANSIDKGLISAHRSNKGHSNAYNTPSQIDSSGREYCLHRIHCNQKAVPSFHASMKRGIHPRIVVFRYAETSLLILSIPERRLNCRINQHGFQLRGVQLLSSRW